MPSLGIYAEFMPKTRRECVERNVENVIMKKSSSEFAKLLKEGLWAIRHRENRRVSAIRDEIGYTLGRQGGSAIEHWAKGNLPPKLEDIELLARIFAVRGNLDKSWVTSFLESAGYPDSTKLYDALFPESATTRQNKKEGTVEKSVQKQAIGSWQTTLDAYLGPPTYSRLFGIDAYVARLTESLLDADDSWIIAIEGMGGLGKTTLADYTIRQPQISQRFDGVAWIDLKQHAFVPDQGMVDVDHAASDIEGLVETLVAQLHLTECQSLPPLQKQTTLIRYLRASSWLIVVDNLESVPDTHRLLPFLQSLTRPSKIVITSRHHLPNYADIAHIRLGYLSEHDAIALLHHMAQMYGANQVASATDEPLRRIYAHVGGNPLALRLVAGQMMVLSLPVVLQNLSHITDSETDAFYNYVYRHSWELLTPHAQKLLTLMSLVDNGLSDQLAAISELNDTEFSAALRQLVRMSWVEVRGELEARRYAIYRLTETFLRKEALVWKEQEIRSRNSEAMLFNRGVQRNLDYWLAWLAQNQGDIATLDRERAGLVKAIHDGLRIADTLPSTYTLIAQLSSYMEQRGQWESWSHILHKAIETAQKTADTSQLSRLSISRARLLRHQSRYREAISEYMRTVHLARQIDDSYTKARAWSNLGHLFIERDHWWRAEVLCIHALQVFEALHSDHGRAHTHNHLGILYTRQCQWDAAWQHLEQALTLWHKMNDTYGLLLANLNLGKLSNDMRMEKMLPPHHARDYLKQALFYGEQTADEVMLSIARMNMGIVYRLDGKFEDAKHLFRTAKRIFDRYGDALNSAMIIDNLGVICGDQGEKAQAMDYFQQSLSHWRELRSTYGEIRTLLYLADWECRLGSKKVAQTWLTQAEHILSLYEHEQKYQSLHGKFQRLSSSLSS